MNNEKKDFVKLCPFKMQVLETFPFIDADFDALTNYELLCKVVEYLNETTNNVNILKDDFDKLRLEYTALKDYVDNYFANLDVQDEINNKIDAMVESGEFEEILAQLVAKSNCNLHYIRTHKTDNVSGNVTVIESEDGNVIIDFGYDTTGDDIANYLILNDITEFKYAIITHYHGDHVGGANCEGLLNILDNNRLDFSNCTFYLAALPDSTQFIGDEITAITNRYNIIVNKLEDLNIDYEIANENDILTINGDISLKILNASSTLWNNYYDITFISNGSITGTDTNYNNFSLVIELTNRNVTALLPADIENKAEEVIYPYLKGNYNIYNAEHHGANDTTYNKYLLKVKPLDFYAIEQNSAIHYYKQSNAFMRVHGIHTLGTVASGNFIIHTDGDTCYATSENGEVDQAINLYEINLGLNVTDVAQTMNNNDDLNDYTKPSIYRSTSSAMTNSMSNCPFTGSGFKLLVEYTSNSNFIRQTLIPNNKYNVYIRYYYNTSGTTYAWSDWRELYTNPYDLNTPIANNTDLDTLTTAGAYYCGSGATAGTLSNTPISGTGFRLEVYRISNTGSFKQVAYPNNSNNYYVRYKQGSTYSWQEWVTVTIS